MILALGYTLIGLLAVVLWIKATEDTDWFPVVFLVWPIFVVWGVIVLLTMVGMWTYDRLT